MVSIKFKLLNRICHLKKSLKKAFCARDQYTDSLTVTSSIQCNQLIRKVVLSEKLTNIERPNHVARDEEIGRIQVIYIASRTDNKQNKCIATDVTRQFVVYIIIFWMIIAVEANF